MRTSLSILRGVLVLGVALGLTLEVTAQHEVLPGSGLQRGDAPEVFGFETGFGPAPIFTLKEAGADFVKVGVTTRRQITHKGQPGQTDPFAIAIPPLPAGAQLVATIINWNYLLNGPPPPADFISINGFDVQGFLCGEGRPDLCWGKEGAASYVAFLDDLQLHGSIRQIFGATDKPLGLDPRAFGDGLSILCVYRIPGAGPRNVDVYCGYTSTESDPARTLTARITMAFSNPYLGGDFHFFVNALDGQQETAACPGFRDDFFINGVLVSGLVAGTGFPGDAWQGFLGPNGSSDLYDHANDDISGLGVVPIGAGGLTASTRRPDLGDCIGHSFGAVSFPLDPVITPPWECWSPGLACSNGVVPEIKCIGDLTPGSLNELNVCDAPPNAPAFLVIGVSSLRVPFKGGILGPSPDFIINLVTDAAGNITLPFIWPAVPAGTCVWVQYWFKDPGAPSGFCATKTLKGTSG